MILVDSSVWIDYLQDRRTPAAERIDALANHEELAVGDLILVEVLQGAGSEAKARWLQRVLGQFTQLALLTPDLAPLVAANYRLLRSRGITVRRTIDMVIGTYCIEHDLALLQSDRDFLPMREHLGLRLVE